MLLGGVSGRSGAGWKGMFPPLITHCAIADIEQEHSDEHKPPPSIHFVVLAAVVISAFFSFGDWEPAKQTVLSLITSVSLLYLHDCSTFWLRRLCTILL